MTGAKPKCARCKRTSTAKHLEAHGGFCADCERINGLPPYSDFTAEALVHKFRREGLDWDKVLAAMKRGLQPPNRPRQWAPAGVWHTLDVHDLGTRRIRVA